MTTEQTKNPKEEIGVLFFSLLLDIAAMFVYVFLLFLGWKWFFVPLGLPEITPGHAVGLAMCVELVAVPLQLPKNFSTMQKSVSRLLLRMLQFFAFYFAYKYLM